MPVDNILSKLDGLKSTAKGKWVAKCPAHDDRSPSLAIREMDDGRVLIHCFAGCSSAEVLDALGLDFKDLMPEKVDNHKSAVSRPFSAADALRCISFEALLIAMLSCRLAAGQPVDENDRQRLLLANARIRAALSGVGL